MAWLSVLTLPIRSNYATDSAAMLGKAVRLIEAVRKQEAKDIRRVGLGMTSSQDGSLRIAPPTLRKHTYQQP